MTAPTNPALRAGLTALLFASLAACPSGDTPTNTQSDVVADAAPDATPDVSPDAAPDASPDIDAATDAADVDADAASAPTFLNAYPLEATFPEGGIYDASAHAFYVGSLGDGSVHRVDAATGEETVLFTPTEAGTWWTLGMDVDEERGLLWVCAMDDQRETTDEEPPYEGFVWIIDLLTGERIRNHALGDAFPRATCTDVALTSDGTGYVCDREHPNIYEVDVDDGASLFASDDSLNGLAIGMNAMVVLPDESALMVVVYLDPELHHVSLADGAVTEVDIDGSFFDAALLAGADGMAYADGSLYVAFTSELVRLDPTTGDWTAAKASETDVNSGMTDVVATPGGLFLLNGQAVRFALGQDPDPFVLARFVGDL